MLKAGAGLAIGVYVATRTPSFAQNQPAPTPINVAPNTFLIIAPDSTVTVLCKHIEMGQGPLTGMATLVAEELDADWAQMRADHAPSNPALYKNLAFGVQGTGGSSAIANSYEQMRKVGAAARQMLVAAAAESWSVPAGEITVENGVIKHGSGKQGRFGEFAPSGDADAGAERAEAEGPLDLQADRQGRRGEAARQRRQVERLGDLHARHQRAGAC